MLFSTSSAAAQFYKHRRQDGSIFYSRLPHAPETARWQAVEFPARSNRNYQQPPVRRGLELRRAQYEVHFAEAAERYQLPVDFLRAVAHVESAFDPHARSVDGARGVMQLMPFTANEMGVTDPHDARQSILGGARLLRILANRWEGDIVLTTAAYNAGSGAVKRHKGVPPYPETQRYVRRVLARFRAYALERHSHHRQISPRSAPPATQREAVEVVFLTSPNTQQGEHHAIRRTPGH